MKRILSLVSVVALLLPSAALAQDAPGAVKFPAAVDTADSLIRATNSARSTLSGGVTNSATTVPVVSTASFPPSGAAAVDNEIFFYSAKTSTSFTGCVRGADSTTAAAHSSGAAVRGVITAAHHNTLASSVVATQGKLGAGASAPAAGTVLRGSGPGASAWGTLADSDLPGTLAGKTLTGATLPSPAITGTASAVSITASGIVAAGAFVGNGAGITGLTGATGGVGNTGSTTLAADSDADGVGKISLQTGGVERMSVEADGSVTVGGQRLAPPVNVRTYGAKGDNTTDDTGAFSAAVAACNSAGGCVFSVPKGWYVTSGGFVFTVPVIIRGDGMGEPIEAAAGAISRVNCTSPTAVLFTFQALYSKVENIALVNTASTTPTAGAGIVAEHASISYNRVDYDSVLVAKFYDNIDSRSGAGWSLRNSYVGGPVRYGLRVRNLNNLDAGDWSISDTVFSNSSHAADSAIRIESSGGGKLTNVKVNASDGTPGTTNPSYQHAIKATLASQNTSILMVSNSSFENIAGNAIDITDWPLVHLDSVEIGMFSNQTNPGVYLSGVTDSKIDNVTTVTNGAGNVAILLHNCARIEVGATRPVNYGIPVGFTGTYTNAPGSGSDGFITPTLLNSWVSAAGWGAAGYGIFNGWVELKGVVTSGSSADAKVLTLGAGYQPREQKVFTVFQNGAPCFLVVEPDGDVTPSGCSGSTYLSLDGIRFRP